MRQQLKCPAYGSTFNERMLLDGDCQYRDFGACRRR